MQQASYDAFLASEVERHFGGNDAYDCAEEYLQNNPEEYKEYIAAYYSENAIDEYQEEVMEGWAMNNPEAALALLSERRLSYLIDTVFEDHFNSSDDSYEREND